MTGLSACGVCLQAVARQGVEAISVRLGADGKRSQAQLDGFTLRALRVEAPAQRHLYATTWRALEVTKAPRMTMFLICGGATVTGARGTPARITPTYPGSRILL